MSSPTLKTFFTKFLASHPVFQSHPVDYWIQQLKEDIRSDIPLPLWEKAQKIVYDYVISNYEVNVDPMIFYGALAVSNLNFLPLKLSSLSPSIIQEWKNSSGWIKRWQELLTFAEIKDFHTYLVPLVESYHAKLPVLSISKEIEVDDDGDTLKKHTMILSHKGFFFELPTSTSLICPLLPILNQHLQAVDLTQSISLLEPRLKWSELPRLLNFQSKNGICVFKTSSDYQLPKWRLDRKNINLTDRSLSHCNETILAELQARKNITNTFGSDLVIETNLTPYQSILSSTGISNFYYCHQVYQCQSLVLVGPETEQEKSLFQTLQVVAYRLLNHDKPCSNAGWVWDIAGHSFSQQFSSLSELLKIYQPYWFSLNKALIALDEPNQPKISSSECYLSKTDWPLGDEAYISDRHSNDFTSCLSALHPLPKPSYFLNQAILANSDLPLHDIRLNLYTDHWTSVDTTQRFKWNNQHQKYEIIWYLCQDLFRNRSTPPYSWQALLEHLKALPNLPIFPIHHLSPTFFFVPTLSDRLLCQSLSLELLNYIKLPELWQNQLTRLSLAKWIHTDGSFSILRFNNRALLILCVPSDNTTETSYDITFNIYEWIHATLDSLPLFRNHPLLFQSDPIVAVRLELSTGPKDEINSDEETKTDEHKHKDDKHKDDKHKTTKDHKDSKSEHQGNHKDEHHGDHNKSEHQGNHKDEHHGDHKDEHHGDHNKSDHKGEHQEDHTNKSEHTNTHKSNHSLVAHTNHTHPKTAVHTTENSQLSQPTIPPVVTPPVVTPPSYLPPYTQQPPYYPPPPPPNQFGQYPPQQYPPPPSNNQFNQYPPSQYPPSMYSAANQPPSYLSNIDPRTSVNPQSPYNFNPTVPAIYNPWPNANIRNNYPPQSPFPTYNPAMSYAPQNPYPPQNPYIPPQNPFYVQPTI